MIASIGLDEGELLTRWTVRIAVILYVTSLASRPFSVLGPRRVDGQVCPLSAFVVAAFHYYHHWSHDAAYDQRPANGDVVGIDWGGGAGKHVSR